MYACLYSPLQGRNEDDFEIDVIDVSLVTLSLNDTYLMEAGIVHRGVSFEPLHLLGLLPMLLRDYLRPVIILRVGMSDEDVGCLG